MASQKAPMKEQGWFHTAEQVMAVDPEWPPARLFLGRLFTAWASEVAISLAVLFNVYVLILETDQTVAVYQNGEVMETAAADGWIVTSNKGLLALYSVELVLRLFAFREEFFHWLPNLFDMAIIVCDLLMTFLVADGGSVSALRIFRLARLGRALKILTIFPELALMLRCIIAAMKSIVWGMVMVAGALLLWAIIAVQLIHPLNLTLVQDGVYDGCERCGRSFESVWDAFLTFVQHIVCGDSWGVVTLPIVEKYPGTLPFFMLVYFTVAMGVLNLILAVIVAESHNALRESDQELVIQKERAFKAACDDLQTICEDLDADKDGSLTFEEIMSGFTTHPGFRNAMMVMDIAEHDMKTVFEMLDEDRSGEVHYNEFVDNLYKLKSDDAHTILVFMRFYVQEILHRCTITSVTLSDEIVVMQKDTVDKLGKLLSGAQPEAADVAPAGDAAPEGGAVPNEAESYSVLKALGDAAPAFAEAAALAKAARLESLRQERFFRGNGSPPPAEMRSASGPAGFPFRSLSPQGKQVSPLIGRGVPEAGSSQWSARQSQQGSPGRA